MIREIAFLNKHLLWPTLIGSLVLLTVFLWKEWPQSGKSRFIFKAFVSSLAIGSLAAIALKPTFLKEVEKGLGVLITEGYDNNQLDSIKNTYKKVKIIKYEKNKPLKQRLDSLSSLFVLGHGLQTYDLWQLDSTPVTYLGGSLPKGISRLNYSKENTIGSKVILNGLYNEPQVGNRLVLGGPGGASLDSIKLENESSYGFSLEADLPVKGKFIYALQERDSLGKLLSNEPLPIKVIGRDTLKILIVNNFPTFETKYLKNYLAEMGHQVLVRSQITKNRYKFEYFNRNKTPIYTFSEKNLSDFDLLIIDVGSYRNMSLKSISVVENSIREEGLGLFIQPNLNYFRLPGKTSHFSFERENMVEVSIQESNRAVSKYPYRFKEDLGVLPSYKYGNQLLAAYKKMGKGRIGTTVLESTYELVLNGNSKTYQQFWKEIIEATSKKSIPIAEWNPASKFAYKDQPFEFKVRTEIENPEIKSNDGYGIPLMQDVEVASIWGGTTYPRNLGWNKLILQNDTTQVYEYFVMDSTKWRSLTKNRTIHDNVRHFNKPVIESLNMEVPQEINPLWFYLVFLFSAGYLWLEPKLLGS
ncbi:hypothetical protein GGR42_000728 [Saonia flava]|uniref:Uncharacterized protein n=1 Tax=Saonia flava TaxID=523696 RepID=A0A846QMN6_9FLAO|nr:hypothetical protein [Saonia flava]NJB70266.1 hypothetical protein [Saonia flava]